MLNRFHIALLCVTVPVASFGQEVELRSSDGFISVNGVITGFNGTMLTVDTSVGPVSVPASEVICFGEECETIIAGNDFGLTRDAFDGVVAQQEPEVAEAVTDELTISFTTPQYNSLFTTISGAFAVANDVATDVDLATSGQIAIANEASNQSAVLQLQENAEETDITIGTVSLLGRSSVEYLSPSIWSSDVRPPVQMVGLDALAVIVAPDVGIDQISTNDLAGIYAGEITNWSSLGGPDLRILPLQLPANSPTSNDLVSVVMQPADKSVASNVLTMADEFAIAQSIQRFPGSISVVSAATARDLQPVAIVGECGVAVAMDQFGLASGDYPLVRPVMVRYNTDVSTTVITEMFDFASMKVAQDLLSEEGFINYLGVQETNERKDARFEQLLNGQFDAAEKPVAASMFQELFAATRLSPTLIGGPVSGAEGAWNRAMFNTLVQMLGREEFAGREVFFVGFVDGNVGSQAAIDASKDFANQMGTAFQSFGANVISANDLRLGSYGFGNVSPASCYTSQSSGTGASRVEVWVR